MSYRKITASQIPAGVRWDVPGKNQGQIVEVAYADEPYMETRRVTLASGEHVSETVAKAPRGEAGPGSRYRRTVDRSDGSTTYEERATYSAGDRVEGGDITEDYDTGRVVEVDGDAVTVAWDGSQEVTTQSAAALRPEGARPVAR